LRVTVFCNYRLGQDLINGTKMTTTSMYNFDNQSTAVLRRWRKEGDITDIPRAVWATGYNYLGSDRYVEDGSFLRLRSATVRYTFPSKSLSKLKLSGFSCYFTAENLLTFTKYTGTDPEVNVHAGSAISSTNTGGNIVGSGANVGGGLDFGVFPSFRTFVFGAKVAIH